MPLKELKKRGEEVREQIAEVFTRNGGNITATARELGLTRQTIQYHLKRLGGVTKPIASGTKTGVRVKQALLPAKGLVKRYILTSAQNNTKVHPEFWKNILALAEHYDAEILVGTYSYNHNAYGELAVKRGTKRTQDSLWYASEVADYICDERLQLAPGLVWCGEMNILPTAEDPLSGLETYSHRQSAIFPHSKLAMRSIPTMQGEGTKLNYTTGTVTLKNYIQKKARLKAEHHHRYSALIVEINHEGNWWVRQVGASSKTPDIQDLNVLVQSGRVATGVKVEAITWGDLHATLADPKVVELSMEMLDTLKPSYQFLHDVMEGASINHHEARNPHAKFKTFLRGLHSVEQEIRSTMSLLNRYQRQNMETVIVDSNHDDAWLMRWLREHDYRHDPANAPLFLEAQLAVYRAIQTGDERFQLLEWVMQKFDGAKELRFLRTDESFKICKDKIECGMHGHLGANGSRGTPGNLNKVGRRANTAHTHSAGIYNGLYVAGTSSRLRWDYQKGPSSHTHSHILTYPNGQRSILTMYAGRWRA